MRCLSFIVVVGLLLAFPVSPTPRAADRRFGLVVHPSNPVDSISREFAARAFLKKVSRWGNDRRIAPVDLVVDAVARKHFSDDVLRRTPTAVRHYWQQKLFSGQEVPPPELDTEEAVIRYVLEHPGAVGYVSSDTPPGRAKVVGLR